MLSSVLLALTLTADFAADSGVLRHELHSSGFGPTITSQTQVDLADLKAMNFSAARTHDWGIINANECVCDYFHIFPLKHLDAKDPKNYVFGPTDYLLKRTREEMGVDVFYRLGTSIEHSGKAVHFNALIPEDFEKVAEIFAGTVRHYNRGWANGYNWNIKYWEIWNEPEGIENMWSPAEGIEGLTEEELAAKRLVCRESFVKFFVTVLKRLKSEFGDSIKVGGPALCDYKEDWFTAILTACQKEGVSPDFISWHGYTKEQNHFSREAERGRRLLDKFGMTNCEMIVDEWHYFGSGDYSWEDVASSDPAAKARIWKGPRSHNGSQNACFTLATLADLQRSKLSQAYFYGCRHTGLWGFKDEMAQKNKVFYALKLFGELFKKYSIIAASTSEGPYTTLALRSADGARRALLVVDYNGPQAPLTIRVKGIDPNARGRLTRLDATHTLSTEEIAIQNGVLTFEKNDDLSVARLIEF